MVSYFSTNQFFLWVHQMRECQAG